MWVGCQIYRVWKVQVLRAFEPIDILVSYRKGESVFGNTSINEECVLNRMIILSRNKRVLNDGKIKHFEIYAKLSKCTKLNCSLMFTLVQTHRVQKVEWKIISTLVSFVLCNALCATFCPYTAV